jgi:hypothetical protein
VLHLHVTSQPFGATLPWRIGALGAMPGFVIVQINSQISSRKPVCGLVEWLKWKVSA